jgi:hypothetical protein
VSPLPNDVAKNYLSSLRASSPQGDLIQQREREEMLIRLLSIQGDRIWRKLSEACGNDGTFLFALQGVVSFCLSSCLPGTMKRTEAEMKEASKKAAKLSRELAKTLESHWHLTFTNNIGIGSHLPHFDELLTEAEQAAIFYLRWAWAEVPLSVKENIDLELHSSFQNEFPDTQMTIARARQILDYEGATLSQILKSLANKLDEGTKTLTPIAPQLNKGALASAVGTKLAAFFYLHLRSPHYSLCSDIVNLAFALSDPISDEAIKTSYYRKKQKRV